MVIELDRAAIEAAIRRGNNADGGYVLSVAPDGSSWRIHWQGRDQGCRCPQNWRHIGIPALFPEGEGAEHEMAEEMLTDMRRLAEARSLSEAEDISLPEICQRWEPERWQEYQDEAVNWLATAFLAACNGDGTDLKEDAPWGDVLDYETGERIIFSPPAEFVYS